MQYKVVAIGGGYGIVKGGAVCAYYGFVVYYPLQAILHAKRQG